MMTKFEANKVTYKVPLNQFAFSVKTSVSVIFITIIITQL